MSTVAADSAPAVAAAAAVLLRQLVAAGAGVPGAAAALGTGPAPARPVARQELRTLELWRAVISECLGAFFYVLVASGAAAAAGAAAGPAFTPHSLLLPSAAAAGLAAAMLTVCFGHISGAHLNPAVTAALAASRRVSPLRACMFVTAQCGGGIAGAALLYGLTLPAQQGALVAAATLPSHLTPWERLALEFVLAFAVAFSHQAAAEPGRALVVSPAAAAGAAYAACSLVSMPALNPARALGPAFVLNKWEHHWVYWLGPVLGGIISGLVYELVFSPTRSSRASKQSLDGDSSSIHSDEDPYDELDKGPPPKPITTGYNLYRPGGGPPSSNLASPGPEGLYTGSLATASLYSAPTSCKLERVESLYGGSKSLYAKSPPLTRANLNRSQSVYSKPPPNANHENGLPRPGPLVPAQSLYPMRLSSQATTAVNQNVQNAQHQQRNVDSVYGVRGVSTGARAVEGGTVYSGGGPPPSQKSVRPESLYGSVTRRQDSVDSAYSSYLSNAPGARAAAYLKCNGGRGEARQSPQHPLLPPGASASVAYRNQRPSPSPQY